MPTGRKSTGFSKKSTAAFDNPFQIWYGEYSGGFHGISPFSVASATHNPAIFWYTKGK
jgi:hypothetical protein